MPRSAASERRSQATRTAETRRRVMDAVVESIAEVGYQRTTSAEIARRAGVTWGAVQHHFGDKDGILMAVLEESFAQFAQQLADFPGPDATIEERVSRFIDHGAAHFCSPHYRSTFEILLNLPQNVELAWQSDVLEAWFDIWRQYFPDCKTARRRTVDLMHYTISVLSGLATTLMLEGGGTGIRKTELDFLKDTLVRELG